ncbi:hypothetical protein JCM3765_006691 [Sporobolomyces pararoseus]
MSTSLSKKPRTPTGRPRVRVRGSSSSTRGRGIESHQLFSLLIRSFLLLFLITSSLILALLGWLTFKSFLKVEPDIIGREKVWLQYGEFKQPFAFVDLPKDKYKVPGNNYDLSLELIVPNSQENFKLGNFMVSISLLNKESFSILNNSRPGILLNHPSTPSSSSSSFLSSFLKPSSSSLPKLQELELPLLESIALNRGGSNWADSQKVEKIYLQVGRKDSHPEYYYNAQQLQLMSSTSSNKLGNELQVFKAFLKIKVKLFGLRALIRSHPFISFSIFFPIFLFFEFLTAFIVYTYFVLRPSSTSTKSLGGIIDEEEEEEEVQEGRNSQTEEEDENDDGIEKVLESSSTGGGSVVTESVTEEEEELTSEPPSILEEEEETEEERISRRNRRQSKGVRIGMTQVSGETQTETETEETETGVSEEEGSGEEWAAIEGEGVEEQKPFDDDSASIGGSETTRATRSSFGPSVTGTSSTRSNESGLRERQGGRIKEEE